MAWLEQRACWAAAQRVRLGLATQHWLAGRWAGWAEQEQRCCQLLQTDPLGQEAGLWSMRAAQLFVAG